MRVRERFGRPFPVAVGASVADNPARTAAGREVLAFDLYGTLVDPIAVSSELDRVLGDSDGREAARLWRLKQLEYSFRLTAMGVTRTSGG